MGKDVSLPAREPRHGAGACLAISGIDMALWDIRGKAPASAVQIIGGARKPIPAYAGGVSLGYSRRRSWSTKRARASTPATRRSSCASATRPRRYRAHARGAQGVRRELVILTDANIGYRVEDVRRVMPAMDQLGIGWLEEPFPAHDYRSYREARSFGRTRSPRARTITRVSSSTG